MAKTEKRAQNQSSKASADLSAAPPPPPTTASPGGLMFRWLCSRTVRHACAMRKHVYKLLRHQEDVLSPPAIEGIKRALADLQRAIHSQSDRAVLEKEMENLEKAANKWLLRYPFPAWRENVEVLLVALAVAMGIRTFFLQPFKIPTGSMQPTLYGVTSVNLLNKPDFKTPTGWERVRQWFGGTSYLRIVAENDGELSVEPLVRLLIFNIKQTIRIGGQPYTLWFPPDFGAGPMGTLEYRAGLVPGRYYHKGDEVIRLEVNAGDHLFVDRVTYNFRPPQRGEIVVFETHGITRLAPDQQDTFYIKRLVGLGGEHLKLEKDHTLVFPAPAGMTPQTFDIGHLVVDGKPLSAATPRFENLYSFSGAKPGAPIRFQENHYYGHALLEGLGTGREFTVEPGHYFVMGDNTMNSSDSRYWGDFPADHVIGKAFFVYWPITDRFGWGYH